MAVVAITLVDTEGKLNVTAAMEPGIDAGADPSTLTPAQALGAQLFEVLLSAGDEAEKAEAAKPALLTPDKRIHLPGRG